VENKKQFRAGGNFRFLTHKKRTDLKNLCASVRFFLLELHEKDCIGGGSVV